MRQTMLVGPRGLRLFASVPAGPFERMRGLLGLDRLEPDRAMLFLRARSVHTFGMRFPIAALHLGPGLEVLARRVVPPGRIVRARRGARHVLECAAEVDLRVGDRLRTPPESGARGREGAPGRRARVWVGRSLERGPGLAILPRLPPAARAPIV